MAVLSAVSSFLQNKYAERPCATGLIPRSQALSKLLDNAWENEIRSITIGRKNYLFCGNHEAAKNMCVVTSLLATCRNHNVNPRLYLSDIIEKMPYYNETTTKEELIELLPHRWIKSHPEAVVENLREKIK